MPSGKYQTSSPQHSPAAAVGWGVPGQEQQLIPPLNDSSPRDRVELSLLQCFSLTIGMGWAWLPETLICKQCRQLWWCLPMPGSSSPGSIHTAEELLYKIRAASRSADQQSCTTGTSPAWPAGWSPCPPPSCIQSENHPKRPLIPELRAVGAQAAQCPASTRNCWAELCCTCRLLPRMWSLNCHTNYKSLTNRMYL